MRRFCGSTPLGFVRRSYELFECCAHVEIRFYHKHITRPACVQTHFTFRIDEREFPPPRTQEAAHFLLFPAPPAGAQLCPPLFPPAMNYTRHARRMGTTEASVDTTTSTNFVPPVSEFPPNDTPNPHLVQGRDYLSRAHFGSDQPFKPD